MILYTEKLSIGYASKKARREVLSDLNLGISKGKLVMLLGSNGTGKTTLIRTLSGLLNSISGKVIIAGEDTSSFSATEWAKHVSLVLTERTDTGNLDVYSLVALGRIPYTGRTGKLAVEDHRAVENALHITGLENFSERIVMELSDGERQRVMIARAIAQDTPIVVLDEPTAFLDAIYRMKLMEWLRDIAITTGKSFVLSTHDLSLAEKYSDVLWIISNNELEVCEPKKYSSDELLRRIAGEKISR